jgi:hypothetical protein
MGEIISQDVSGRLKRSLGHYTDLTSLTSQLAEKATSVKSLGAKGDGVADDTVAIQNAVNSISAGKVFFPYGAYKITSTIILKPNIILEGISKEACVINSSATGFAFSYQTANGTGENNSPQFKNLTINCNSGIQLNSQTGGFTNDSTTQGYVMRPLIEDCIIIAKVGGSGTGVQWSKCFDGHLWRSEIINFQYDIDFMGCDICSIKHNRLRGGNTAQIRVQSNQTFGSQTLIQHNDMLSLNSNSTAFIISSDHYLIVKDNYFEQVNGSGINSVIQILSGSLNVIIQNNRVETPAAYITNWLNVQTTLLLLDSKNNTTSGSAYGVPLFPAGGVKYFYNNFLQQKIVHSGNTVGGYPFNSVDHFDTGGKNAYICDPNLPGLDQGNYGANCLVLENSFVLPPMTPYQSMIVFHTGVNGNVNVGVIARGDVTGQTLGFQQLSNGSVVATSSVALTTTYAYYTLFSNANPINLDIKLWNIDTTNNSNIYIRKLSVDYV